MILSESSTSSDIAKNLKDDFSLVQHDSVVRRIKRLFTNKYFNPYKFYDKIIRHVISNYKKKHKDKRVHIIFDHMFSRDGLKEMIYDELNFASNRQSKYYPRENVNKASDIFNILNDYYMIAKDEDFYLDLIQYLRDNKKL